MSLPTNETGDIPGTKIIGAETKNDIKSFQEVASPAAITSNIQPALSQFFEIQREDYSWKVKARKFYGRLLMSLLFIQNFFVFALIVLALFTDKLKDLQLIFSIIIPATLVETAFMVRVIIQWMFKDIEYPK